MSPLIQTGCEIVKREETSSHENEKYSVKVYRLKADSRNSIPLLGMFLSNLMHELYKAQEFSFNLTQFYQIVSNFTSISKEARLLLLEYMAVGRLLDIFYDKHSPCPEVMRRMDDVPQFILEKAWTIGEPSKANVGPLSFFDKKTLQEQQSNYHIFFFDLLSQVKIFYNFSVDPILKNVRRSEGAITNGSRRYAIYTEEGRTNFGNGFGGTLKL